MNRRAGLDLIVIGGGVVGTTAALAAARDGLRVALVEAHPPQAWREDEPDLRVFAIAPDALAMFEDLGVGASIRAARAHAYRRMRVWDAAGGGELVFDADRLGQPCLGRIIENRLLVDRLWAACQAEANVELHCPARLQGVEQDDSGVRAQLDDGRELSARLLLGTDGGASRVRSLCGIDTDVHDYRQRGLVAYVGTERPHEDTAWQRFLPTGPLAFLPFSDGRCSIVWSLPTDEAERLLAVDEARFRQELARGFDARLGEITSVSVRAAFPLRRQLAKAYVHGRVLLAGDAAHVVHPLAGQGVNLGLRDVAALRRLWREAGERGVAFDTPHRLARWERERRSDVTVSALGFETINRVFSNDAMLPTFLRGHLLGLAGRLPPVVRGLWRRAAGV